MEMLRSQFQRRDLRVSALLRRAVGWPSIQLRGWASGCSRRMHDRLRGSGAARRSATELCERADVTPSRIKATHRRTDAQSNNELLIVNDASTVDLLSCSQRSTSPLARLRKMISCEALVVAFIWALFAAVHSAVIPTMMFANRLGGKAFNAQQRQALSPSRHTWQRMSAYNPWNDGSETYGYVADRHPSSVGGGGVMDDLSAVLQQQQQQQQQKQQQQMPLVYGVPHRYFSEPAPKYAMPASDDLYENPLFYAHPFNVLKRSGSALSPAVLSSYYDLLDSADVADVADDMEDFVADDYEPPLSRQDVLNFEKYVQRYFQQPDDQQYTDDWTVPNSDLVNNDINYDVQNDEEAARQLHLLLRQPPRRPVIATREISKKSMKEPVSKTTTSATTSTSTSTTSTTQAPTTAYGKPVHYQQQGQRQGQKEEPMLRPPTSQRHSARSPASVAPNGEEDASIYHTIQRLMTMHNHLSHPDQKAISEAQSSTEVDDDASGRPKRFVAMSQELLLNQQIHSLDKIKA